MRGKSLGKRLIAMLLVICMAVPQLAQSVLAESENGRELAWEEIGDYDGGDKSAGTPTGEYKDDSVHYNPNDLVRVSIVLESASTMDAGYDITNIAGDAEAAAYRDGLREEQLAVTGRIESQVLDGQSLDVVWNLTLTVNIISANVLFGQIDAIKAVEGVSDVFVENKYAPERVEDDLTVDPQMATSGSQIGSTQAWEAGYTGAGSRIAVIDTGIDAGHKSFDAAAFLYSLKKLAEDRGKDPDEYIASLHLLTAEEIESLKDDLNVFQDDKTGKVTSTALYLNEKVAFAYNYVDSSFTVDHANDGQSEHGSHVAGIAAANRFVNRNFGLTDEPEYVEALKEVKVQGVAPDAQLIVMKIFGKSGSGHDSDIFAALEDAIVLGCDSVNLSLGSNNGGYAYAGTYEKVMERLAEEQKIVMVAASGNYYSWAEYSQNVQSTGSTNGYLHGDDVNFLTGGYPGTYPNALTVASVNNNGGTGMYITVKGKEDQEDKVMVYWESNSTYGVDAMAFLGSSEKEYDYIFMDCYGEEADFEAVGEANIRDKIVFVNRGGGVNLIDKATRAAALGAKAVVIINNQSGTYSFAMTGYADKYSDVPVINVNQHNREAIIERADKAELAAAFDCYTGRMTVSIPSQNNNESEFYNDEYNYMSYYSSWGIPGTLELKPEITAPGGNIYSVDGKSSSHHVGYENMSGTSMASPQVAGMAALLAQYVRETGLDKELGVSQRQIITSLLMSTATPIRNKLDDRTPNSAGQTEPWYSVMWQGAGLANVGSVINASSYITMGSDATQAYADGKVKAELGANEDGKYAFHFTVHNFSDHETGFNLNTELFTQDLKDGPAGAYLDQITAPLLAAVTYTADGVDVERISTISADVDGDGDTDADDAQAILDNMLNSYSGSFDSKAADVDGDGNVTTYDAHLILSSIASRVILVPAGEEVEIGVDITVLTDVSDYVNGAYVEGFTFVTPIVDEEGKTTDVTHSIPILGFYGNWSDPSMFERSSFVSSLYGDKTVPYFTAPSTTVVDGEERTVYDINYLTYYDKSDRMEYTFMGNPYGVEDEFPAERGAIRSDQEIRSYTYALIRNAGVTALVIRDHETGEILHIANITTLGYDNIAAYHTSNGWMSTSVVNSLRKTPAQLEIPENTTVDVSVLAVPEYYTNKLINSVNDSISEAALISLIKSGELGDGVWLTTTLTVDDTKPEIDKIIQNEEQGPITVVLKDNQYIAYLGLKTRSGVQIIQEVYGPDPDEGTATAGGGLTYTFELTDEQKAKIGTEFMLVVADYAGNQTAARVKYEGGVDPDYTGKFFAIAKPDEDITKVYPEWVDNTWFTFNPEEIHVDVHANPAVLQNAEAVAYSTVGTVTAAEYVDGYVFYVAGSTLYAASIYELEAPVIVSDLSRYGLYSVSDLAFNYKDNKLYAMNSACSTNNVNPLWQIDPLSGEAKKVAFVNIEGDKDVFMFESAKNIVSFAIDGDGNFYGATRYQGSSDSNCSRLVTWTVDALENTETTQTLMAKVIGPLKEGGSYVQENDGSGTCGGSMTWDFNENKLYLINFCGANGSFLLYDYMWEIDTTNANAKSMHKVEMEVQAMFCVSSKKPENLSFDPTDEVGGVMMDKSEIDLFVTGKEEIGYYLTPWTLMGSTQVAEWVSENPEIAAVDEYGVVTGMSVGSTTITCTVGGVSSTCTVNVEEIPHITLTAAVYDEDANIYWSDFDVADPTQWHHNDETPLSYEAKGGTLADDGYLYVHDGMGVYRVDPDTYEKKLVCPLSGGYIWSDAAMTTTVSDRLYTLAGLNSVGEALTVYALYDNFADLYDLSRLPGFNKDYARAAVLAYEKTENHKNYAPGQMSMNKTCLTDFYYMLTEKGDLYRIYIFPDDDISSEMYGEYLGVVDEVDLTDVALQGQSRATMIYDKTNNLLVLVSYVDNEENNEAKVQLIDPSRCKVVATTYFPELIWPVVCGFQHERIMDIAIKAPKDEFNLKAGISVDTQASVIWDKNNEGLTWKSRDEKIATVDEHGVITGVDTGETTIIATTKALKEDGKPATKEFKVTVQGPDKIDVQEGAAVRALVEFEDGHTAWVEIPLNDPKSFTEIDGAPENQAFLTGGGIGADGYIYGSSIELTSDSNQIQGTFYKVDPMDNYSVTETTEDWWWQTAVVDMANTPDGSYGLMLTLDTGSTSEDDDPSYKHGAYVMGPNDSMTAIRTGGDPRGNAKLTPNLDAITYFQSNNGMDTFVGLHGDKLYSLTVKADLTDGKAAYGDVSIYGPMAWNTINTDEFPLNHVFGDEDNISMIMACVQYNNLKRYNEFVVACADGNTVDLYTFGNCDIDWDGGYTKVFYLGSIPGATDISCLHTIDDAKAAAKDRLSEQGGESDEKVPDPLDTDVTVRALLKMNDGSTAWVDIPLKDVAHYTTLAKNEDVPFLTGGGLGAGGYIYGSNIEFGSKEDGTLYKLDPTNGYALVSTTPDWPWQYAPMGVTVAPDGKMEAMLTYGTPGEQSGGRSLLFLAEKDQKTVPSGDYGLTNLNTRLSGITYLKQVNGDYRFIGIDPQSVVSYMDANAPVVDGQILDTDAIQMAGFEMKVLGALSYYPFSKMFDSPDDLCMQSVNVKYGPSGCDTVVAYTGDGSVDFYYFNYNDLTSDGCYYVRYLGTIPDAEDISCLHLGSDIESASKYRFDDEPADQPVEKIPETLDTDISVRAQIKLEDGRTQWVEIPLNDPTNFKKLTEPSNDPFLAGGGLGAGGYIYGAVIDGKNNGTYYKIDPADGNYSVVQTIEDWPWQYTPIGVAATPDGTVEIELYRLGSGLSGIYYLGEKEAAMLPEGDYDDNYGVVCDGNFGLKRDLSGIAYGYVNNPYYQFLCMDSNGLFYMIEVDADVNDGKIDPYSIETGGIESLAYGGSTTSFDFSSDDHIALQHVNVNKYNGKFHETLVGYSGDGTADLFYFNLWDKTEDGEYKAIYLGSIPGAVDIACLHLASDVESAASMRTTAAEPEVEVQGTEPEVTDTTEPVETEEVTEPETEEPVEPVEPETEEPVETEEVTEPEAEEVAEPIETTEPETEEPVEAGETRPETANEVTGGLMAITVERPSVVNEGKDNASAIDRENRTVSMNVSANSATNGLVTVSYDPALLTFKEITTDLEGCFAYSVSEGSITIAFASGDPVSTYAAQVVFAYAEDHDDDLDTAVTIQVLEDGADLTPAEPAQVPVKVHTLFELTVHYVDEAGNAIRADLTNQVEEGTQYSVAVPGFTNYTFRRSEGDLSGTVTGNIEVTLVYAYTPAAAPEQPDPEEPGDDGPGELPDDNPPQTDEPGADEPGTDLPDEDPPLTDEPGTDVPGTDEPGTDVPGDDEPGADLPDEEPPLSDTPVDDLPATGDDFRLGLWTAVMAVSGIAAAVTLTLGAKKRRRN